MNASSTSPCACTACPGAHCACGCQSPATPGSPTGGALCACAPGCACGCSTGSGCNGPTESSAA